MMKSNFVMFLVLAISINIISSMVYAQGDPADITDEWHIQVDEPVIFIGSNYWINVSGVSNTNFNMEILNMNNTNISYSFTYFTNEYGATYIDTPKTFGLNEEAGYEIIIYVNGTEVNKARIRVLYDEFKSMELEIEELKRLIRDLYTEDALGDEKDEEQDRLYFKWLKIVLGIVFPIALGHMIINGYWHYYEIQERRKKFWEDLNTNKPMGGLGMELSRDHRMLYPGHFLKAPVFKKGMPGVTDDMVGLTKELYHAKIVHEQKMMKIEEKNRKKANEEKEELKELEEDIDLLDLIENDMEEELDEELSQPEPVKELTKKQIKKNQKKEKDRLKKIQKLEKANKKYMKKIDKIKKKEEGS